MIKRLLIANRGEIACRIIKTAKRLGIYTIAIHSPIDATAKHTLLSDIAYPLSGNTASDSYLDGEKILAIAKEAKADAIHPGYGFLSENADFATSCEQHNIIFVGPPAQALELMGSKQQAKIALEKANIPLIPGYHGTDQSFPAIQKAAKAIGYPLLLKAAAGGGGKGMRLVEEESGLKNAFDLAKSEAKNSFGDDTLIIEKYLEQPRHIELQIIADKHGKTLHLFDRDCSIQRRHQKIIEEAPAFGLPNQLRQAMADAAVRIAETIGYYGAGTIEFLQAGSEFYFMEMNTRLQVEHPVSEKITGLDLVELQLEIAADKPLALEQADITSNGHAIEVRIYAEDADADFKPCTGKIYHLKLPEENTFCRLDDSLIDGMQITPLYDPMLAKLISWGDNRESAIAHLQANMSDLQIAGVTTNQNFLLAILGNTDYQNENVDTSFINKHSAEIFNQFPIDEKIYALACMFLAADLTISAATDWDIADGWQSTQAQFYFSFLRDDKPFPIQVSRTNNSYTMTFPDAGVITINTTDADYIAADFAKSNHELCIFSGGIQYALKLFNPIAHYARLEQSAGHLNAPMPGTIVAINTKNGQTVHRGDSLLVIEAMKMQHTVSAPTDGEVKQLFYTVGDNVDEGNQLLTFESA